MQALMLHMALATDDLAASHARLCQGGASSVSPHESTPAGDQLAMLRDPFGLPLQLVCRKTALVP